MIIQTLNIIRLNILIRILIKLIMYVRTRRAARFGRGDDTVGNPHRAQISQFELFELILLLKSDKRFPVERFEAAASQSAVPSPPLRSGLLLSFHRRVVAAEALWVRRSTKQDSTETQTT